MASLITEKITFIGIVLVILLQIKGERVVFLDHLSRNNFTDFNSSITSSEISFIQVDILGIDFVPKNLAGMKHSYLLVAVWE
jgi:UDP-glucose 4-epimerase